MLFSLVYFLVRRLLGVGSRRQDQNDIELLVLRHQVKVLQRQVARPRLNRLDRVLLAAASRRLTKSSWSAFLVRPETLLQWHRELVRRKWTYRRMGQPGRPPVDADVRALVVRLGRENPRWGYQRIRGERMKLEIRISATTVRTILLRSGLDPAPRRAGPTWTPVPPVTGGGDLGDRLLQRRDDRTEDDLGPVLHRALDPPRAPRRRHRPPRLGVGHRSRRGTSPSTSGCRAFGSSCATETPSSADRSMRCSAPRASGSSERRSAHLGRMPSPSGSCGPCAKSVSTTS